MTAKDLGDVLTTIAEKAKLLRDAGVVGPVTVDGVSFELVAALDPQPAATPVELEEGRGNALDDGDTFGGFVPQRRERFRPTPVAEDDDD